MTPAFQDAFDTNVIHVQAAVYACDGAEEMRQDVFSHPTILGAHNYIGPVALRDMHCSRRKRTFAHLRAPGSHGLVSNQGTLDDSDRRLVSLLDFLDDVIWSATPDGTTMLFLNPAFERVYGRKCSECYENPNVWLDAVHPEDRDRVWRESCKLVEKGNVVLEYRIVRPDGELRWLLDRKIAIFDDDGNPVHIGGIATDITERKRADEERERLIAELENKNAELERFSYTVSHDMKSPLITIRGFVDLLEADLAAGDRQRVDDDVKWIRDAAENMHRLLQDLLDLSRMGRIVRPPEKVSMSSLARDAVDALGGVITEAGVHVQISPGLPDAFGDRCRLLQVLQNLIENAVKFTAGQPRPHIRIDSRRAGSQNVYFVQDNGMGVDPRFQEKIFCLFTQLTPGYGGSGIGLALAKRIVEVHGGSIWVESEGERRGSTFCFTIP